MTESRALPRVLLLPLAVIGVLHLAAAAPPAPLVDCNHNGIEDAVDIAFGTSSDVDQNGVPDECEARLLPSPPGR